MRKSNNDYNKLYRARHPQRIKESQQIHNVKYPERRILRFTKYSAKRKNLEFNLTIEDIVIPELCPYLGVPITTEYGNGRHPTNASIDRINPALGYVKGNIQIISFMANTMKSAATREQLLTFAHNIIKVHS